jgi:hypothetical protein
MRMLLIEEEWFHPGLAGFGENHIRVGLPAAVASIAV